MRTEIVTTLKRNATDLIKAAAKDKRPVLITQRGQPAAYLVDVESYDALHEKLALLEAIARGEQAYAEGRFVSHAEAKKRMARWLK